MSAPSSMWSTNPPPAHIEDVLDADELEVVRKMRAAKTVALRKTERKDRLDALRREVAKLEAEGL